MIDPMRKRYRRIRCKKCKTLVTDSFQAKWRHLVEMHPGAFMQKALPFVERPDEAFEIGRQLGELFKRIVRLGDSIK
jgi:hypothetical protein